MMRLALLLSLFAWSNDPWAPEAPLDAPSTIVMVSEEEPGQALVVSGTVFGPDGATPIPGASVFVYHTDADGRYTPGSDQGGASRSRLRGWMRSDNQGRYEYRTIKPGPYPNSRIQAHIHYVVSAPGYQDRNFEIVFAGDPYLNERILSETRRASSGFALCTPSRDASGVLHCSQDVRLQAQESTPERSPLEATYWGVVYDVPETRDVTVRSQVPYLELEGRTLSLDIYLPADAKAGETRPAVVFLNAVGDRPPNMVKSWGIYSSWPRLVAAHGLVGISMDAEVSGIQESLQGVFDFLTARGAEFGVDGSRLGVYAASANVRGGYQYLAGERAAPGIRAAALYYGSPPEGPLRADLPVLFIVAQGDVPGMGASLTGLWQRVVERAAPWTLLFGRHLPHGFDAFSDNDDARRIIQQSIAFWKSHLEPVPQPSRAPELARSIVERPATPATCPRSLSFSRNHLRGQSRTPADSSQVTQTKLSESLQAARTTLESLFSELRASCEGVS